MADRLVSPARFRAEGAAIPWPWLARRQLSAALDSSVGARTHAGPLTHVSREPATSHLGRILEGRAGEVHLRWACSEQLGTPPSPFIVWWHPGLEEHHAAKVAATPHPLGQELSWDGRSAAVLDLVVTPVDANVPVQVFACRGVLSPTTLVGHTLVHPSGTGQLSLVLMAGGFTRALLLNATLQHGTVDLLRDVVNDGGWQEFEVVGLPTDRSLVPDYDDRDQGMVDALTDPVDAAVQRVKRGGPPLGWWPVTELGTVAPPWSPADPHKVVDEVRDQLLPIVAPIYREVPFRQVDVIHHEPMDRPEQDGRQAGDPHDALLPPFGALLLAATTDPYLALATGFGTAYDLGKGDQQRWFGRDFLVTADYPDTPEGRPATYAAYVPWPGPHLATAPVTDLTAGREGLVQPLHRDEPWRETVRLRWRHVEATAALGRPSGIAVARAEPAGTSAAESLLTPRDAGGWRTLIPVPEPPAPGTTTSDHERFVDVARDIPLGSGGRTATYAVANHDVFGVWSPWEDVGHVGPEPAAPLPRIMRVGVDAAHAGTPVCPSTLEVQFALDWIERTPRTVEVVVIAYPATSGHTPPPDTALPEAPTPPGCLRSDVLVTFTGAVASAPGVQVTHLDAAGEEVAPGPAQSQDARRYQLIWDGPGLDFGPRDWWGAVVWARLRSDVVPAASGWAPVASVPGVDGRAYAHAASPLPPYVPPPPLLPGVPVGSTPDSAGRSHVRVRWPAATGSVASYRVWELTEGAVRSVLHAANASVPLRAEPDEVLGDRLLWLRLRMTAGPGGSGGSGLPGWRSRFQRVAELPGTAREADITLERGSDDIHLFVVTAVTPTGIESPWPTSIDSVQAFAAPRVLTPRTPALRSAFGVATDGSPTLHLNVAVASAVPVDEIRLLRTRSTVAARSEQTMGPPFATVPATATGAVSDTGEDVYQASWEGPVPTGWAPTRLRAVAVPVAAVPAEAVVGAPSVGSPVVIVDVPPAAGPTLELLVAEVFDGTGIVVRTATDAPVKESSYGVSRLEVSASSGGTPIVAPFTELLREVVEGPSAIPPGAVATGTSEPPLVRRDLRDAGRSPLAAWLRRADAATAVQVRVRVIDPLGRTAERTVEVAGAGAPAPATLDVVDRMVIVGRGAVVVFRSDAPVAAGPDGPHRLLVRARTVLAPKPPLPPPAPPRSPFAIEPPSRLLRPDLALDVRELVVRGTWKTLDVSLPDIEVVARGTPRRRAELDVVRTDTSSPYDYQLLVTLATPVEVELSIVAPDGRRTDRSVRVGR